VEGEKKAKFVYRRGGLPPGVGRGGKFGSGGGGGGDTKGVYYELAFSEEYMGTQQLFVAMAATHDPQNIADILHQHPYHLDTLLQMSEIYSQMGEQQQAADMLERAIYCLESACHPAFLAGLGGAAEGGAGGTSRLAYESEQNKVFYHALFRHMQVPKPSTGNLNSKF